MLTIRARVAGRLALLLIAVSLVAPVAAVRASTADHFNVSISGSPTAGTPVSVTIEARDGSDLLLTDYAGTVHFTSSDSQAVLPGDTVFTGSEGGTGTFPVTFKTSGSQSVDVSDGPATGTGSATVSPGGAKDLTVAGFTSPATAGLQDSFTVTALDPYGNKATGYTGTVHFTSTDGAANLPSNYDFVSGDSGDHVFNATLNTAGTKSITATDTGDSTINGTQSGIVVQTGGLHHFVVAGFADPVVAGVGDSFTVTAKDASGNTLTGYTGTVQLDSSDTNAVLAASYHFVSGDNGVHSINATLKTAGPQSITATDGGATGSQTSITVTPATATHFTVGGFTTPATAGSPDSFTVTAKDAFNNVATGYSGTVHFTSSDGGATLPANYHFLGGDNGAHSFNATLNTTGTQSITATDTVSSITGIQSGIVVNGGSLNHFVVAGFADPTVAGVPDSFTVTAEDVLNNTLTGYTGTVHFTSTDGAAVVPANYTFVGGDNGTHAFNATLKTVGIQSITATDGGATGSQTSINVTPAAATHLTVAGFTTPATAGASDTFTVTAKDAFDNVATGYGGIVHFTSSDGIATLPANYDFVGGDSGTHMFSATLRTVGTQSISATDTVTPSITGSQTGIVVNGGSIDHFIVAGFADPVVAGVQDSFSVTAKDLSGNTLTGYTGTVQLASSDGNALLPASYHFVSGDNGVHSINATLKTVGSQSITATDGGATGSQTGISVNPAVAASLTITTAYPDPTVAGVAHPFTITLTDAFGNIATGYRGTVHVTSSDGAAVLPANHVFIAGDAGVHVFSVTLNTSGERTITATDTGNGALTDTQSAITVGSAGATSLVVAGYPDPTGLNATGSVTVTAKDGSGNTATGYTGNVLLSTSGGAPTLPAAYTFKVSDSGVHTFNAISFGAPGTWTLTATDTGTSSITGSQTGISVTNQAPTCSAPSKIVAEHAVITDTLDNYCSDADLGPSPLAYSSPSNPPHGTISGFLSDGSFTYTPDLGYVGADGFTATASDGNLSVLITYSITVTAINDAPVFVPGVDQTVLEDALPVQTNAWATGIGPGGGADEAAQTLNFIVTNNHNPFFSAQPAIDPATGNLTYTLAANANGNVTVTVRLHDNGGTLVGGVDTSAPVTFHIAITAVNDAPSFVGGAIPPIAEQQNAVQKTISGWATALSDGPSNESSQNLVAFTVTVDVPNLFAGPAGQPAVNVSTGTLTYTPAPHRNGTATLTVILQDDGGTTNLGVDSSTQQFTLTITGVDDPPLPLNDSFTVVAGSPATSLPVLTNDNANNPDQGEVLTILSTTAAAHGTVTIATGGTGLRYKPAAGFHGSDRFNYTITDPGGHHASATVLVSVPVDTIAPIATVPVSAIVGPQTLGTSSVVVRISWSGTDTGGGIARYELYRSVNGRTWAKVSLSSLLAKTSSQRLTINASYRFRVRAVDKAGNVGVFRYGPTFKAALVQETPSTALTYVGTWGLSTSTSYSGGHSRASSIALDSVTYAFTGQSIAFVAPRSSVRGSASIVVDGVTVASVSLYSTTLSYRQVVYARYFPTSGAHTIQIIVRATAGHPRVDLDAFVVLH